MTALAFANTMPPVQDITVHVPAAGMAMQGVPVPVLVSESAIPIIVPVVNAPNLPRGSVELRLLVQESSDVTPAGDNPIPSISPEETVALLALLNQVRLFS